jgi:hypothetical protein
VAHKKKSPHQKIVVGFQPVAPVVGLGPLTRGTVVVVASPEAVIVKPGFGDFLCRFD